MKKKKILIVDSSEDMCWVLSQIINSAGYDCYTVGSKQKLANFKNEESADLLIIDYKWFQSLNSSGLKLISKYLKKNQAVLTSSLPIQELQNDIGSMHFSCFLEKPFDINGLVATINGVLGGEA